MLMHLAETRNGRKMNLLVLAPTAAVHIEQPSHAQSAVGRAAPERSQHQILADANFVGCIDQGIVQRLVQRSHNPSPPLCRPAARPVRFLCDWPPGDGGSRLGLAKPGRPRPPAEITEQAAGRRTDGQGRHAPRDCHALQEIRPRLPQVGRVQGAGLHAAAACERSSRGSTNLATTAQPIAIFDTCFLPPCTIAVLDCLLAARAHPMLTVTPEVPSCTI
jgi:hypothetical protein